MTLETIERLRDDLDHWIALAEARQDHIAALTAELEYAYRCIHFGFKFGNFDFSALRERASKVEGIDHAKSS